MAQAARDYLGIPGSEVDVKRLFNTGRNILGLRRGSIGPETLRGLVLLKDHLRRQKIGSNLSYSMYKTTTIS